MRTRKTARILAITVAATSTLAMAGCASTGTDAQGSSAASTARPSSASSTTGRALTSSSTGAATSQGAASTTTSTHASSAASGHARAAGQVSKHAAAKSSGHPTKTQSSTSAEVTPASAPPTSAPKTQGLVLDKLPGSKANACVSVGSQRDVTSGTIAMGNFQTARKSYKSQHGHSEQPTVNLYVIPMHRSMPGVRITMTPIKAKGKTRTIKSTDVEQADIWSYYGVQLPVPSAGTWRLTVTSGADRGCFNVSFQS